MATCKQTAAELIQDVFSPCVAVLCSNDAELLCAKNNLTFVEMVQPFCRLNTEVNVRDPSNIQCSVRNLRIVMKDLNSQAPPVNLGKKMMYDAVSNNVPSSLDNSSLNQVVADNYELKFSTTTPWFEAYREVFFQVFSPTDHEFIQHYLSCIFVVSSSHQDPLSQFNDLGQVQAQQQIQNSRQSSKWFFSYTFKYYVLLHDTSDENLAKAEAVYQSMKSCFGSSACHLLQINSAGEAREQVNNCTEEANSISHLPDPWSQFLPKYYIAQDCSALNDGNVENCEPTPPVESPSRDFDINVSSSNKGIIINHPLLNNSDELTMVNNSNLEVPNNERVRTSSFSLNYWGKSNNRNKKHGLYLTASDMDRIRVFVQEFCLQGLVPFIEKHVRILNDQVTNRKSIHKTIFGVTKKLFAGNKPGVQSPTASVNSVIYGQDAPELQVRKLGDLAFLFQMYEVAYQAYHTAKRDFSADNAWLYFAGAAEMAALSVFMQGNSPQHEYPARYIENAITTYLFTCKLHELAMRATFLSTECLKAKGLYRDAALQFMRMPGEADLPCALFLEQAAHCFICCKPPKVRKYAFHIVLAGHRFSKAGQRKHAQRAYKLAEQVYKQLTWNYANNHINMMIGRFSVYLNQLDIACSAFRELLISNAQQPPTEQANYLKEYLLSLKQYLSQQSSQDTCQLPSLPIPIIDCQSTKVLLSEENAFTDDGSLVIYGRGFEHGDLSNNIWARLEEMLTVKIHKNSAVFIPQLYCLTQNTDNTNRPIAVTNEMLTVEIVVKNPLNVPFAIDNVFLLWTFTTQPESNSGKEPVSFSNELDFSKAMMLNSVVQTEVLPRVTFEPLATIKIHLTLKPVHVGSLLIRGLAYSLISPANPSNENPSDSPAKVASVLSMQGKQYIELKGPRLNRNVNERTQQIYAPDQRLNIQIEATMPKLQVKYKFFPCNLFCGEVQSTTVEFSNCGQQKLQRLFVASPTPSLFALGIESKLDDSYVYKEVPCIRRTLHNVEKWQSCDWVTEILHADGSSICLSPGQCVSFPLWVRGPDEPGEHNLQLLYYYEVEQPQSKLSYRLVQHSININTRCSLSLQANAKSCFCYEVISSNDSDVSNASPLILSLELGNISEELTEISIIQVSCISPSWFLSLDDENMPNNYPVICAAETSLLTFKALSQNNNGADDINKQTRILSRIPLGHFEIDSHSLPCSEFTKKSIISMNGVFESDNFRSGQLKSSDNIEIDLQLLLTVIWQAKIQNENESYVVYGQHHVSISDTTQSMQPVRITETTESSNTQMADDAMIGIPIATSLVKCVISHPFHIQHNFKKKRLVSVPVEFIVKSICNMNLYITIDNTDISHSQSTLYNFEEGIPLTPSFLWINGSRREIKLNPRTEMRIPLLASFCNPGTYNLGCLSVNIRLGQETTVNYIMSPYPIVISACDLSVPC